MLGRMLRKIRKDKELTKVFISKKTGINMGHITHIEKEERNPSHKALRSICDAMDIAYEPVSYMYDKDINEEHLRYKIFDHISYDKIIAVDSFDKFITCPATCSNSSIALKIQNDEMEPYLSNGDYGFLELNTPLDNKDVGLIELNGKFYIRRFIIRKDKLVLRADNKIYPDIDFSEDDNFIIYGKITNSNGK